MIATDVQILMPVGTMVIDRHECPDLYEEFGTDCITKHCSMSAMTYDMLKDCVKAGRIKVVRETDKVFKREDGSMHIVRG
jgi:hypothetical protein